MRLDQSSVSFAGASSGRSEGTNDERVSSGDDPMSAAVVGM
jgi:hypothetical protein